MIPCTLWKCHPRVRGTWHTALYRIAWAILGHSSTWSEHTQCNRTNQGKQAEFKNCCCCCEQQVKQANIARTRIHTWNLQSACKERLHREVFFPDKSRTPVLLPRPIYRVARLGAWDISPPTWIEAHWKIVPPVAYYATRVVGADQKQALRKASGGNVVRRHRRRRNYFRCCCCCYYLSNLAYRYASVPPNQHCCCCCCSMTTTMRRRTTMKTMRQKAYPRLRLLGQRKYRRQKNQPRPRHSKRLHP